MADISDGQDIAHNPVPVPVNIALVGLDIVQDHGSLQLGPLLRVNAHIVSLVVEVQGIHVELAGDAVRGLPVEPADGFVLVC